MKSDTPRSPKGLFAGIDRALGRLTLGISVLTLPLSLLLFLQWPLRDLVQAYSREANDLAQCLFAIYVSAAITYATRRRGHLAADAFAHRYPVRTRAGLERIAALAVLVPWSLFVLYAVSPIVLQSVRGLEAFPESYSPGYFVIKLAVALLALLVLIQALIDGLGAAVPRRD